MPDGLLKTAKENTSIDQKGVENFNSKIKPLEIKTRKKLIKPRTSNQQLYLEKLLVSDIVFGVGPAGTGKTYLAVAVGVSMYLSGSVDKIILTRPAVEAGERLGFLPGDMKEKVDPYMQPLYEAQNATAMQMKMFLTRLGEGSKMAITGDPSQIDLPKGMRSGLTEALKILNGVKGISFLKFDSNDVVRHRLVTNIVKAYEKFALAKKKTESITEK